jgi:hypothetical protein
MRELKAGDTVIHKDDIANSVAKLISRHKTGVEEAAWVVRLIPTDVTYFWLESNLLPEPPLEALARALEEEHE